MLWLGDLLVLGGLSESQVLVSGERQNGSISFNQISINSEVSVNLGQTVLGDIRIYARALHTLRAALSRTWCLLGAQILPEAPTLLL